jgi:hypothetical protein
LGNGSYVEIMLSDTDVEKHGADMEEGEIGEEGRQPLRKLRKGLEKTWQE